MLESGAASFGRVPEWGVDQAGVLDTQSQLQYRRRAGWLQACSNRRPSLRNLQVRNARTPQSCNLCNTYRQGDPREMAVHIEVGHAGGTSIQ